VHTLRAIASGASDRWDDAVRALRRAIAIDARNPTLSYTLAQYLARLKRPGDATQALRGAQRALDTGRASTSAGQSPRFERVSLLSQSSDTAPIFAHARYADGFAALESGDYETAVAKFETAIATDPMLTGSSDARSRVVAAASALRSGQIDAALRQLQAAVEIFPNAPEAHRLLGLIYWIDDRAGKGIEHLRRAIQLAPADERARVLLSDVFASERRLAEAERELTQAADASVRSGQIPYRLAQIYLRRRCCPRRRRRFRTASRSHPWSAGIASTSRGAACW
jgi:tetratricopeptide (TPR) repeat protein